MAESLATQAFRSVNTEEFATLTRKARLEAFCWAYCRTIADAPPEEVAAEAAELGVSSDRLGELGGLVNEPRAKVLAEVLRMFGDRPPRSGPPTELDRLFDDIMGTTGGYEGTIPGDAPIR